MQRADERSSRFPHTPSSALLGALSDDPEVRRRSWDRLARAYHAPVCSYVRIRWRTSEPDARDLAQAFFERCIERDLAAEHDPARGRFRTYLRLCLDHFVADRWRAERSQKRGGDARSVPLDAPGVEVPASDGDPEALFEAEWTRRILELALEALRAHCREGGKDEHLRAFERYHLEGGVQYDALASELGVSVVTLTHRLAYARRHFRRLVLEQLRELTATDEEYREEARAVLGIAL